MNYRSVRSSVRLSPDDLLALRRLRARAGETRTTKLLGISKTTLEILLHGGKVMVATRDRVATRLGELTMDSMTEDEMIVAIEAETPLKACDVRGLYRCTTAELQSLVQSYLDMGAITNVTTWEKICGFMARCASYAAIASPLLNVASFLMTVP